MDGEQINSAISMTNVCKSLEGEEPVSRAIRLLWEQ